MAVFGYGKRTVNKYGLLELREVSFEMSAEDLRRVAGFFLACADQFNAGEWRTSHQHLSQQDSSWSIQHPDLEIVVINPSPTPPKSVE